MIPKPRLTQLVAELEYLTHVKSPGFHLLRNEESLAAIIERGIKLVEKNVHLRYSVSDFTGRISPAIGRPAAAA